MRSLTDGAKISGAKSFNLKNFCLSLKSLAVLFLLRGIFQSFCFQFYFKQWEKWRFIQIDDRKFYLARTRTWQNAAGKLQYLTIENINIFSSMQPIRDRIVPHCLHESVNILFQSPPCVQSDYSFKRETRVTVVSILIPVSFLEDIHSTYIFLIVCKTA